MYATSNGLLISRQDIPTSEDAAGFNQYTDLRNIHYTSDSWNGPGAVLIPTNSLDLDLANVDIVGTRLIRSFVPQVLVCTDGSASSRFRSLCA